MTVRAVLSTTFVLIAAALLTGCAGAPAVRAADAAVDPDTVVAVPPGESALADQLRRRLSARGWSLTRYDPVELERNRGYAQLARRARYRLTLSAERIGNCRAEEPSFLYNLALISNQSGDVAVALTGAQCVTTTLKRFDEALDRKRIAAPGRATTSGGAGG